MVKTIDSISSTYAGHCEVYVNDREFDSIARITMLLLIAHTFELKIAANMMIHPWYSACLPKDLYQNLNDHIRPIIEEVCEKISNKDDTTLQAKTWRLEGRQATVRFVLPKSAWYRLLSYFSAPEGLTRDKANETRRSVVLAPGRKDHLGRVLNLQQPYRRVAEMRYRETGVLMPFSASMDDYQIPNPYVVVTNIGSMTNAEQDLLS